MSSPINSGKKETAAEINEIVNETQPQNRIVRINTLIKVGDTLIKAGRDYFRVLQEDNTVIIAISNVVYKIKIDPYNVYGVYDCPDCSVYILHIQEISDIERSYIEEAEMFCNIRISINDIRIDIIKASRPSEDEFKKIRDALARDDGEYLYLGFDQNIYFSRGYATLEMGKGRQITFHDEQANELYYQIREYVFDIDVLLEDMNSTKFRENLEHVTDKLKKIKAEYKAKTKAEEKAKSDIRAEIRAEIEAEIRAEKAKAEHVK